MVMYPHTWLICIALTLRRRIASVYRKP